MLSDHTIADIWTCGTTIVSVLITQYFYYRANVNRNNMNAAEVRHSLVVQEKKLSNALTMHQDTVADNFESVVCNQLAIKTALEENTEISKNAFQEANKIAAVLKVNAPDQQDCIEALTTNLPSGINRPYSP